MKLTIVPVRKFPGKGKSVIWKPCEAAQAQAYEVRSQHKTLRVNSRQEAERMIARASKKASKFSGNRTDLVGRRWEDVKHLL